MLLRLIVLIGVLVFSGFLIWHGLFNAHEARMSEHWPTVEGKVLSHSVSRHWHRRSGDTYEPIVWYEYTVDGTPYKESRIAWYEESFSYENEANHFLESRYPVGRSVPVHYNPNHPHHACLIAGEGNSSMAPVFAGVMVAVVSVVTFVVLLMRKAAGR